jgi:hypothetical protein
MRLLLLLLLGTPFFTAAQINRSANEFARERVEEFLATKIFKDQVYKTVSYGELKAERENRAGAVWSINVDCWLDKSKRDDRKEAETLQAYRFTVYLDKKLKIVSADASSTN